MSKRVTDGPSVSAFRQLAEAFCSAIDQRDALGPVKLIQAIEPLLPGLCHGALHLPDIARPGPFARGGTWRSRWGEVFASLRRQFADHDAYWEVFDPYQKEEAINGSLADDLSDIYADLKFGLDAWVKADAMTRRNIVYDWRSAYEFHWGRHAIDAMRAIHSLMYTHNFAERDHRI